MTNQELEQELRNAGEWGERIWHFLQTHPEAVCRESSSYECEVCQDTGWIYEGKRIKARCKCVEVKAARQRLKNSGLMDVIDRQTFDSFLPKTDWQQGALTIAKNWVKALCGEEGPKASGNSATGEAPKSAASDRPWLYFGGAVGCGKTHLCTAACGEALKAGKAVRYMLWTEEARRLKACVNDEEEYDRIIYPLKTCEVLYIDDLLKVQRGDDLGSASPADIRLAFELIDARYRMHRPTVISCEWTIDDLLRIDEGVASRIIERSRGFIIQIKREAGRNVRMAGE